MDKNQSTGLLLIALLLMAYYYFFMPKESFTPVTEEIVAEQQLDGTSTTEVEEIAAAPALPDSINQLLNQQRYGALASAMEGTAQDYVLENNLVKYVISSQGAFVKSVELKEHKRWDGAPLMLLDEESSDYDLKISTGRDSVHVSDLYFAGAQKDSTLTFTAGSNGKNVQIKYAIPNDSYILHYNIKAEGAGEKARLDWTNRLKKQERRVTLTRLQSTVNFYNDEGDFDDLSATATSLTSEVIERPLHWFSMKQLYFTAAMIQDENAISNARVSSWFNEADSQVVKVTRAEVDLALNKDYKFYFGPNKFHTLDNVTDGFSRNLYMGYGPLRFISRWIIMPLFTFLEGFISNYGLLIFLMVVIIKLVLSPLSYKSYHSMAKTKVLKPELDLLKEKHGDDMQAQQKEQMELYSKVGVNPLSGCIPMVLQMPILFSLFFFFPNAIELRQQPFLWAEDLSTYDSIINLPFDIPFYGDHVSLFTLLMCVSTILYTWYNSSNTAAQMPGPMQYVQYMLPLMFLFFFNSYAAGLTYYYFLSNIFTFSQMAVIRNFLIDEDKIKAQLEENKKKNVGKKKSKFQQKLEDALKAGEEQKKALDSAKAKKKPAPPKPKKRKR